MLRVLIHAVVALFLTILTQIGGVAWIASRFFPRKLATFLLLYLTLTLAAVWIAPLFGRVAISCFGTGPLKVQSTMYCALNRNYVTPELADVLHQTAGEMAQRFPGTDTLVLDANFPFVVGFPLLPHLSHDDGEKADLAFYYRNEDGFLNGVTRSPIGYFAFEQGPTVCPQAGLTLRWDLAGLQPLWPDYALDKARNRAVLNILSENAQVGRIFVEPHLAGTFGVSHPKIRFQGCRAARHDDHIHIELKATSDN